MNYNELIDSTIRPYEDIPPKVLVELVDCLLEMVNLADWLAEQWRAELNAAGHDCSSSLCEATNAIQETIKKLETQPWNLTQPENNTALQ